MTKSWLKTSTKPCESELHWDTTCFSSVMQSIQTVRHQIRDTGHSYPLLPSGHLSWAQNSQVINQCSVTGSLRTRLAHIFPNSESVQDCYAEIPPNGPNSRHTYVYLLHTIPLTQYLNPRSSYSRPSFFNINI